MSYKSVVKINVFSLASILGMLFISLATSQPRDNAATPAAHQIEVAQQIEIEPDGRELC